MQKAQFLGQDISAKTYANILGGRWYEIVEVAHTSIKPVSRGGQTGTGGDAQQAFASAFVILLLPLVFDELQLGEVVRRHRENACLLHDLRQFLQTMCCEFLSTLLAQYTEGYPRAFALDGLKTDGALESLAQ